ncbi:aminotransferase class V-fold PLP-dependent enzyme [Spirillospora sp. CA-294931]|uniref:aminotransferase class V-fold PLP-dependent enzyme n=1 Tax=Spirillospora sp. CA-294931 TaxID=3240042 RepID=UPI003D8B17C5
MIDLAKVRAETPGCSRVAHFNNAGAALPPLAVIDAVADHLDLEAAIGGYEADEIADEASERFYDAVAGLVGAGRDEIAYVENATRAWDMAFYAIPFGSGDRILTTRSEYASNGIALLQVARNRGARVEVVPDDEHGQISLDALEAELAKGGVKLVAINHVPTHNGLVNPAEEVGRLCRAHGVLYLLDACQSVGQCPVDVEAIGCDMLSATGRKFLRGPRGTGFLYVRRSVLRTLEPPFLDLHSADWTAHDAYEVRDDARRFETWERFVAGQIGLGVAADYAVALGLDAIEERTVALAERLREGLASRAGVTVLDRGLRRSGIVTFTVAGQDPTALKLRLREVGVNVSVANVARQRFEMSQSPPAIRASVHYYNDEDEIERLLANI